MIPIQGLPPAAPARSPARAPSVGSEFSVAAPAADDAPGAIAAEPMLGGLLALQESGSVAAAAAQGARPGQPRDQRDRRARARGRDLLEALAALQGGLLGGGVGAPALRRLAALAEPDVDAADLGLRDILAEIRLRARVELARYGVV